MYKFSPAFADPKGSPIRALYQYLSEPGMVSFAGGYPDAKLFDVEGLRQASERAYGNSKACLEYGGTDGTPAMKAQISRLTEERGAGARPENIVVTTGSQQGFDLLLRILVEPGDLVCVEQPTYSTNIQAVQVSQARVAAIPVDAHGLDVDALEELLKNAPSPADRPRLLYAVPTFSNPSGATLTVARRLKLLALAAQYQFVIVEDDPYSDLRFEGEAVPSLLALAAQVPGASDWVVHLASLSKIVAPGLRVGWIIAPVEIARRCSVAKQSADVGSSPWTQGIAAEYLASGRLNQHLPRIRQAYGAKCRTLAQALRTEMGDALSFQEPEGGMFIWARLQNAAHATELLQHAIPRKVMFVPGAGFQAVQPDLSALRLSFATPTLDEITQGVRNLADAWRSLQAQQERTDVATA